MRKAIFLDMDGVVNSYSGVDEWLHKKICELVKEDPDDLKGIYELKARAAFVEEFNHSKELILPDLAERVSDIVEATGADIIWSSSWRRLPDYDTIEKVQDLFNRRGLPGDHYVGCTPWDRTNTRETHIMSVIRDNEIYTRFAVLDDLTLYLPENASNIDPKYEYKFFHIDAVYGIQEKDKEEIIKWLNRGE